MVIDSGLDPVCEPLSVTWTVKLLALAAAGVPLITPATDNVKPAGNAPDATDQEYGGVPPVAAKACKYALPTVAAGKGDAVVIESGGGLMAIEVAKHISTEKIILISICLFMLYCQFLKT